MKSNTVTNVSLALLLACSIGLCSRSAQSSPVGAKDLFVGQLNLNKATTPNLGLSYSIELRRDGKIYKVDNRFPFKSGDQIRFHVRPNIDGYMYIVLDSEQGGHPSLMFPRSGDENNAVTKGVSFAIPEKGLLTFDEVPGVEALKLVLSPKKLEHKADKMGRSITIREKPGAILPAHFAIDFAAVDPEAPVAIASADHVTTEKDFEATPAQTMVTTLVEKPLVLDLMLRHQSRAGATAIEMASNTTGSRTGGDSDGPEVVTTGDIQRAGAQGLHPLHALSGSSPVADKWAVVVGISSFKNPRWNLNYPAKDAKDFAQFLIKKCNFAPDHVRILTDAQATRERILTDVGSYWLPMNAKPNDMVCIYMATHGTSSNLDVAHKNFLMAYDTDPLNPFATGIELQDLARNVVRRLQSKRVVLILDTCHSGAVEAGAKSMSGMNQFDLRDLLQGTGQLIIASAAANQIAHDSARYPNGIFTKQLMDGLTKYDKLSDAFKYVRQHVQDESTVDYKDPQTPVLKDAEWKGEELRLAVRPIQPRKPAAP